MPTTGLGPHCSHRPEGVEHRKRAPMFQLALVTLRAWATLTLTLQFCCVEVCSIGHGAREREDWRTGVYDPAELHD